MTSHEDNPFNRPPQPANEQRTGVLVPGYEKAAMRAGDSFVLDGNRAVLSAQEFGIPETDQNRLSIIGAVSVNEEVGPARIGIAKEVTPLGAELFHLVTTRQDENNADGTPKVTWAPLPIGLAFTVGRENTKNTNTFLTGEDLIGRPFDNHVSRQHFTVETTLEGVKITSLSELNQTYVEGVRATEQPVQKHVGSVAAIGQRPHLIDFVPKTAEDLEAVERQQREAAEQPVRQRIAQLRAERDAMVEGMDLSQHDYTELDAYSLAKTMKTRWQKSGNGEMSIASGQNISAAYNSMSARARTVADKWHQYTQLIEQQQDKIR